VFKPEEVIFAPTGRCNLHCRHCRVSRPTQVIEPGAAIGFLAECADLGVDRVGFSGGEPFLEPAFLRDVCAAAVDLGLMFDRLMTNGVWFEDEASLRATLAAIYDAGFDGQIGLSVDTWHDQATEKVLAFVAAAFDISGRRDCVDILSVRAPDEGAAMQKLKAIADASGGKLVVEEGEPIAICDTDFDDRLAQGEDVPEALRMDVYRFPYSASAAEGAWKSALWFEDDFCEGPGNVLYVHPDGRVAACCGFANENPALVLGSMGKDSLPGMLARAKASPHIAACYEEGLGAARKRLSGEGVSFPGKTADMCFFCDYVCKNGLIK
jgi:hypothetical protein